MAFVNSSGYAGLTGYPRSHASGMPRRSSAVFLQRDDSRHHLLDHDTESWSSATTVQFTKQPIVRWKPYQKNQDPIPQEVDLTTSALSCAS